MLRRLKRILSIFLAVSFAFQQTGFGQTIALPGLQTAPAVAADHFRPQHLRYLQFDPATQDLNLLLDKGDTAGVKGQQLDQAAQGPLDYFYTCLSVPEECFWVNLRPDAPDQVLDKRLLGTAVGRIFLEADLQLKKDTAAFTSPRTKEGREYWDRLYKKAGELYGADNVSIPTLTRPWIVPGEILLREGSRNAYIYKASLKVMLESDYLKSDAKTFSGPRQKELNEYSSQLIRELIIPKIEKDVNTARRYAPLRQVYYSLILADWFRSSFGEQACLELVSRNRTSPPPEKWACDEYFQRYRASFTNGEYNIKETAIVAGSQEERSYFSGGVSLLGQALRAAETVVSGGRNFIPGNVRGLAAVNMPAGSSGMMKAIGRRSLDEEADLSSRHAEFEALAAGQKAQEVYGASAVVVSADLGWDWETGAYHFRSAAGQLVIVVNERNTPDIQQEGRFHESREAQWIDNGYSQHEAHIIASAQQALEFSRDSKLTAYHQFQLETMDTDSLKAVIDETEDERAGHHAVLARAGFSQEDIDRVKQYEFNLRKQAGVLLDGEALENPGAIDFNWRRDNGSLTRELIRTADPKAGIFIPMDGWQEEPVLTLAEISQQTSVISELLGSGRPEEEIIDKLSAIREAVVFSVPSRGFIARRGLTDGEASMLLSWCESRAQANGKEWFDRVTQRFRLKRTGDGRGGQKVDGHGYAHMAEGHLDEFEAFRDEQSSGWSPEQLMVYAIAENIMMPDFQFDSRGKKCSIKTQDLVKRIDYLRQSRVSYGPVSFVVLAPDEATGMSELVTAYLSMGDKGAENELFSRKDVVLSIENAARMDKDKGKLYRDVTGNMRVLTLQEPDEEEALVLVYVKDWPANRIVIVGKRIDNETLGYKIKAEELIEVTDTSSKRRNFQEELRSFSEGFEKVNVLEPIQRDVFKKCNNTFPYKRFYHFYDHQVLTEKEYAARQEQVADFVRNGPSNFLVYLRQQGRMMGSTMLPPAGIAYKDWDWRKEMREVWQRHPDLLEKQLEKRIEEETRRFVEEQSQNAAHMKPIGLVEATAAVEVPEGFFEIAGSGVLRTFKLWDCSALLLWDPVSRIGALAHLSRDNDILTGITEVFSRLRDEYGLSPESMQARLVGGFNWRIQGSGTRMNARESLQRWGIKDIKEDYNDSEFRSIEFDLSTGTYKDIANDKPAALNVPANYYLSLEAGRLRRLSESEYAAKAAKGDDGGAILARDIVPAQRPVRENAGRGIYKTVLTGEEVTKLEDASRLFSPDGQKYVIGSARVAYENFLSRLPDYDRDFEEVLGTGVTLASAIIAGAKLEPDHTFIIVEPGCGDGAALAQLDGQLKAAGVKYQLYGFADTYFKQWETLAREKGIRFILDDAMNFNRYFGHNIDICFSRMSVHLFEDEEYSFLKSAAQAMAPGGTMLVSPIPNWVFPRAGSRMESALKSEYSVYRGKTDTAVRLVRRSDGGAKKTAAQAPGGIDFRGVSAQMARARVAILQKPAALPSESELSGEWRMIQQMVNRRLIPSSSRLRDYVQALWSKGSLEPNCEALTSMLADIFRMEEERNIATDPVLRDLLFAIESL